MQKIKIGVNMEFWTEIEAEKHIWQYGELSWAQKKSLLDDLNARFPPPEFRRHRACRQSALRNVEENKSILCGATQRYPRLINAGDSAGAPSDLAGYAVVLTAGGDGERLRASLLARGTSQAMLENFTKATFGLPGFPGGYGSLQVNCAVIADMCDRAGLNVPVIITTGPASSANARIIPSVIKAHNNFGLKNVRTLSQDERLHLTMEGTIAYVIGEHGARPITNPDETGGPFVKLSKPGFNGESTALEWLTSLGCEKIIALQATALYDPAVILAMAAAGKRHDCIGVGVLRKKFEEKDQFGTYVDMERNGKNSLVIIEQGIRNETTMRIKDASGTFYLPYNTGLYMFDIGLLSRCALPDYATPPKEVLPSLPRSPKIGYAATDIVPCAHNGAILAIEPDSYENIKNADDLEKLSAIAERHGLLKLCR
jgi:hypothetical protein